MADNSSENARYRLHFGYGFVAIQNGNIYARNQVVTKSNLTTVIGNKPRTVEGGLYIQNCAVREASKFTVQNYINRDSWNPMCSSSPDCTVLKCKSVLKST
nr:hypothetical protein Itr_chr12CG02710 [Ipomoea trifida]